jgi:hypothetical protein
MTHRQFRSWMEWDRIEKNRPSRTDHYLMQIAMEVRAIPYTVFATSMPNLNLGQFKIPFKVVVPEAFNPEGSKSIWLSILRASSNHSNIK